MLSEGRRDSTGAGERALLMTSTFMASYFNNSQTSQYRLFPAPSQTSQHKHPFPYDPVSVQLASCTTRAPLEHGYLEAFRFSRKDSGEKETQKKQNELQKYLLTASYTKHLGLRPQEKVQTQPQTSVKQKVQAFGFEPRAPLPQICQRK